MKTEVYSWRVSGELRSELEREARIRKVRVSAILDLAVREWLRKSAADVASDEEQKRLHAAVAPLIGSIKGNDPHRSEKVRQIVRKRLRQKYGR